jgi:hypothetical protein
MKWVTCGACCRKPGTRGPHTPRCNIVLLGGMAIHKTCLPPALLGISTFAEARATHLLLCSPFHLTVVASFCFILCRSRHASRFLTWPAQEGLVDFMCRLTHLVARSPPLFQFDTFQIRDTFWATIVYQKFGNLSDLRY